MSGRFGYGDKGVYMKKYIDADKLKNHIASGDTVLLDMATEREVFFAIDQEPAAKVVDESKYIELQWTALELLKKYKESESAAISELSFNIDSSYERLNKEIEKYKNLIRGSNK